MDRRRAVAIAAATVATTLGAVAAVAVNFGLPGFGAASQPLGQIDGGRAAEVVTPATGSTAAPTAAAPNVTVRYEDIYLPAPAPLAATAPPAVAPMPAGGNTVTAVSADTGAVTVEDPGAVTGGYEQGDDHDDSYDREGGDHEDHEEEADD